MGRYQHRGVKPPVPQPHRAAGLQSHKPREVERSMGAPLTPLSLRHEFMDLSLSMGRHLSLLKPFAVFGQLLEMSGTVSLLSKAFRW